MEKVKEIHFYDTGSQWASKVNEIEAVYKTKRAEKREMPIIASSRHSADILKSHYSDLLSDTLEYFSVLFLNKANRVIGWQLVSQGGYSGTVADSRFILRMSILVGASHIILCHNHPSGKVKPSMADQEVTKKIKEACRYHDITLVDHIILSSEGYFSFNDDGIL